MINDIFSTHAVLTLNYLFRKLSSVLLALNIVFIKLLERVFGNMDRDLLLTSLQKFSGRAQAEQKNFVVGTRSFSYNNFFRAQPDTVFPLEDNGRK